MTDEAARPTGRPEPMDCSFTPDGQTFVFDAEGKTLRQFKTKRQAVAWIYEKHFPIKRRESNGAPTQADHS